MVRELDEDKGKQVIALELIKVKIEVICCEAEFLIACLVFADNCLRVARV